MRLIYIGLIIVLASCAQVDPNRMDKVALEYHFTRQDVMIDGFNLRTYQRITNPTAPLRLYIEGDGRAWLSVDQPSPDPTPRKALGLMLAAADPFPNVAYLARPCQFNLTSSPRCETMYWTDKRFSEEIIAAMNQTLDTLLRPMTSPEIELVGYSGGAAVAVLLSARRHDVSNIRTVAGNLDIEAVNRFHRVSAMPDSLNPINVAPLLATLPQVHFTGGRDKVIPATIAEGFILRQESHCATTVSIPEASHEDGWISRWPELLAIAPTCQ